MRSALAFAAGVCVGAAVLYFLLWWNGHLRESALPTAVARSAAASPVPAAPATLAASALPPTSAAAASPSAAAPASLFPSEPTPLLGMPPAPEPPSTLNPFAPSPHAQAPEVDAPPPNASPPPDLTDFQRLKARAIAVPVEGVDRRQIKDNFTEMRGAHVHEAIDIPAPRGQPVLTVDDGVIKKLFASAQGGLTIYEFDRDSAYCYYYAHLDRYAEGLKEGQAVKKGDRIGYVGTSGNAPPNAPHLHFTIFRLGPEKRWWQGTPINPYPLWMIPELGRAAGR